MSPDDLYRHIVETSPDGIWVVGLDGRTIYANQVVADLYGVPLSEVTAMTVFDTLDDAGQEQFAQHLRDVRAGRTNDGEVEVLFSAKDGSQTWLTLKESLLRDDDGEVVGILHRISDYQERRLVLHELETSRSQLAEAQRIAKLGSWSWDVVAGRASIIDAGVTPPLSFEVSVGSPDALVRAVHPDDRADLLAQVGPILEDADEFELDTRVGRHGTYAWTRLRGFVTRDAEGRALRLHGTHQDVTEIKSAEAALLDQINQAAFMRAVSAAANEAHTLQEVLQHARPLLMLHDDWERSSAFLVDDDGGLVDLDGDATDDELALAREVVDGGRTLWSADRLAVAFGIRVRERTYGVGIIRSAPPLYRHEMIESMVEAVAAQLAQVAERELAQRSLAEARDAAMAASRHKSEFLATMSHEIRTPLNGIIGLGDLLRRTSLDPDQLRLVSGMHVASRALLNVINDVLDFSKIEGGRLELEQVEVAVRPLLDQVARVLSSNARENDVDVIVMCDPDVPTTVTGDPTRLSQVLLNLVSNAVKFSPGGEVLVRASVDEVAASGEGVVLRFDVRDNGIGIEPDQVAALFEPFRQADASTTRRFGGTGLGLAIAHEITSALGGELTFRPNPAGGSIFSFTAVLGREAAGGDPLDEYARTWLSGRRVLVADPNAERGQALVGQLRWWRARGELVPDPASALATLAEGARTADPYEALLVDETAADALVGGAPGVVTLVLTSDPTPGAVRPDADGVLSRPVPSDLLRHALLEHVARVPGQPFTRTVETPRSRGSRRVLVVEDNPVNQLVATGILESLGYVVEVSDDGAQALDRLAEASFDAVLMDVQMPVLDGYSATRTLREREHGGHRVPVIAMTATAVEGERERCLAAGMDDFLTKPVDPSALAKVLGRWTEQADAAPTPAGPRTVEDPVESARATAGLDVERLDMLRDLDPGDTSYLDRAIGNFCVNSVNAVAALQRLLAEGDVAGVKATAHKIAGSALNLGAPTAGEAARALELLADTGTLDGGDDLLAAVDAAMADARRGLLAYQATYTTS